MSTLLTVLAVLILWGAGSLVFSLAWGRWFQLDEREADASGPRAKAEEGKLRGQGA